jgi:hypothetical protein
MYIKERGVDKEEMKDGDIEKETFVKKVHAISI